MTPKEQYEARKAERALLKELDEDIRGRTEQVAWLDMMDRFVTAVEQIAVAMSARSTPEGEAK